MAYWNAFTAASKMPYVHAPHLQIGFPTSLGFSLPFEPSPLRKMPTPLQKPLSMFH
jgi:hypothetical protein